MNPYSVINYLCLFRDHYLRHFHCHYPFAAEADFVPGVVDHRFAKVFQIADCFAPAPVVFLFVVAAPDSRMTFRLFAADSALVVFRSVDYSEVTAAFLSFVADHDFHMIFQLFVADSAPVVFRSVDYSAGTAAFLSFVADHDFHMTVPFSGFDPGLVVFPFVVVDHGSVFRSVDSDRALVAFPLFVADHGSVFRSFGYHQEPAVFLFFDYPDLHMVFLFW